MESIKYLVIREALPMGDRWEDVFDSLEQANREASYHWNHLTRREQQRNHVYVVEVRREWLSEDAIDEDTGAVEWAMFDQADTRPGFFDSDEPVAEAEEEA